ncbi:MAG: hypothetical protein NTW44_06555 [Nitrospirae bacterium]|nr:hypothetical protein [Nitrospirota bacterium]
MDKVEQRTDNETANKYMVLLSVISDMEDRLRWTEIFFLFLNIVVLLFTITFISSVIHKVNYILTYMDLALFFICIIIGMSINAYWTAFAMRVQLKLKLRYFQARFMERKLNCAGEYIYSDESIFFDPAIRRLESPDNKETLHYPTSGLTRMDGFIGAAKPRYFSWLLPCLFVTIYWLIFLLIITRI